MSLATLLAALKSLVHTRIERLRNTERLDLLRGSVEALWDWNMRSDQVRYSQRFRELLGYSEDEPLSKSMIALHPGDRERVADALRRHLLERAPIELEFRLRCRNGEYRWFRGRAFGIHRRHGHLALSEGRSVRQEPAPFHSPAALLNHVFDPAVQIVFADFGLEIGCDFLAGHAQLDDFGCHRAVGFSGSKAFITR